jgi:hypothetical protein
MRHVLRILSWPFVAAALVAFVVAFTCAAVAGWLRGLRLSQFK